MIYNLIQEKYSFDGTSKNCGMFIVGEDSRTIQEMETMMGSNGMAQCAMVVAAQFRENDTWLGRSQVTFSNFVVLAHQVSEC